MSCIRFKFKSSIEYEKLTFDGLQISLGELKEAIMKQKKIGLSNQYTLRVVDAQSKKVYEKDDEMLARNTSVVISRIPLVNAPKIPKTQLKDPSLPQPASSSGGSSSGGIPSTSLPPLTSKLTPEELVKTANLVDANATEEEKVMAMMNQSAVGYDPSQYVNVKYSGRRGGMGGGMSKMKPPPTYICYRCGQTGHFINQCPTNGNPNFDNYRYKRLMGTPSNQLMPASMNMPGAMIDRHGNLVVREVDFQAYIQSKMKGKTGTTSAAIEAPKEMEIPPELICSICKEVVKDAVIIPCCGESFCYDCIQEYLCENEFTCPSCKAPDVSPEKLAPNKALRASAKNFKMKAAEIKSEAEARGFTKQTLPPAVILNSTKQLVNKTLPITSTQPTPITSTQPAPITSSQPPTSSQPSFPSTATTSVASSAVTTATSTTAAATTTSGSLSQESTSSLTSVNPPSSAPSAEPGSNVNGHPVSVPSAPVAVGANTIVRQETRGKPTVGRSLSPALEAMMGGLVAAASGNVSPHRSGLMVNGLPGRSTGSVPVVKTNVVASAMTHLLPPRPLTQSISKNISDNAKLADLLLGPGPPKKSPSPPPLSADEFYRQQKLLKLLTKKTTSRSATPGSYSHSSGSDSSLSRSDSHSRSRSRSRTRSWSYDSRSRSRSPHHGSSKSSKHSSHRSTVRKHRSHRRHRHQEKDVEKSRERERTSRRPHRKRARHDESRDKKEEGSKRSSKRHRSRTRSPERKKHKEDLLLARDTIISPDMDTSTPTLSDAECGSKVTHKHKHKKRSKRKHRHREREEEKISEKNDLTSVVAAQVESRMEDTAGETALAAVTEMSPLVEDNVADAAITKSSQKSSSSVEDEKTSKTRSSSDKVNDVPSAAERVNDGEIPSVESTAGRRDASQQKEITKNKEKIKSNLVPYQDSSTTEAEPTEDTTLMSGSDSKTDVPDQSATPLPTEEDEDMEESLLLDVHVDESIDELEEELMGAPLKKREAKQEQSEETDGEIAMEKEEGEISDSEEDSVPTKPAEPKVPQSTHSPLKQSSRIACDKPLPPQPQEDLRAEIERSRQKHNVQSNLSFLPPAIVKVKAKDKSGAKKRKRKVVTPPTESENDSEDEYSSDEEESSSSSNEDESDEIEHTKRRRVSKSSRAKRSKHKHTSKSKDKEREREREIAKERKREREIAKERKREREIAKEREREREIAKEREREREIAKEREREREIAKERERERAGRSKAKKSSRDKKLPKKPKEKSREKVKRKKVKSSSKSRKTNKQ